MMAQLSDAVGLIDRDDGLWVGVLCAVGERFHRRARHVENSSAPARKPRPEGSIDSFGMASRCRKPIVAAI